MVAAGYDLPYIQAQVGHVDPTTTLAVYAQIMRRSEGDQLRTEIRQLLGVEPETSETPAAVATAAAPPRLSLSTPRPRIKAPKGPTPRL
jgi:hypothetical protein